MGFGRIDTLTGLGGRHPRLYCALYCAAAGGPAHTVVRPVRKPVRLLSVDVREYTETH